MVKPVLVILFRVRVGAIELGARECPSPTASKAYWTHDCTLAQAEVYQHRCINRKQVRSTGL